MFIKVTLTAYVFSVALGTKNSNRDGDIGLADAEISSVSVFLAQNHFSFCCPLAWNSTPLLRNTGFIVKCSK